MERNSTRLSFLFPEFRFSKFNYEGEPYIICSDAHNPTATISVFPDKPVFSPVSDDKKVEVNQFVVLRGEIFQFVGRSENGNIISLLRSSPVNVKNDRSVTWKVPNSGSINNNTQSSQVGFRAPVISGKDISSEKALSTDKLQGKYLFIDFWRTTCSPCIAEFKHLREVYAKFDRRELEIIGVVDERRQGSTEDLLKKHEVKWPNIKAYANGTVTVGYTSCHIQRPT